jgi:minimal PKS chain-length factor (CLF/KS beta)
VTYTTTPDPSRRSVLTGIGVVAPNGIGTETWWEATKAGTTGIGRIERFDPEKYSTQLAGCVDDFNADDWIERRLQVQTDRWTHMALAATQIAFEDAKFDPSQFDEMSTSAITASSSGGNEFGQKEIQALWGKGPKFVGAYQSIAWFYAATTGQISIKHGLKGPCGVVLAEGAGGLESLQHARRTIRRNVDTIVAGGTEGPIGPYAITCQMGNGYMSTATEVADAYRPFDTRANGYIPGEGGAILLVESTSRIEERGAPNQYCEIVGYGATNDAHHWGLPAPDGVQYARAITVALGDAGISADDVDVVFADAFGVPEWDAIEVAALKSALGKHAGKVPVTAPKSMVGRLYAGGSSLDVAAAALAMRDGVIPPTVNLDDPADGFDLDFVTAARDAKITHALVVARGYGGFNAALVLRRVE